MLNIMGTLNLYDVIFFNILDFIYMIPFGSLGNVGSQLSYHSLMVYEIKRSFNARSSMCAFITSFLFTTIGDS